MPELPEVETIVRGLRGTIGDVITCVDTSLVGGLLKNSSPSLFAQYITNSTIKHISRHGKWIRFDFNKDLALLSHLGMFGNWTYKDPPIPHARLTLRLNGPQGERYLTYNDMRSWGRLEVGNKQWADKYLGSHVGIDALDVEFKTFCNLYHRCTAPISVVFLDQFKVAGVGNIYRSEILHASGVAPDRPCTDLSVEELDALWANMLLILKESIRLRGSSVATYRDSNGEAGRYQELIRVYGRTGKLCTICGSVVQETKKFDGRSVFYCPDCQK